MQDDITKRPQRVAFKPERIFTSAATPARAAEIVPCMSCGLPAPRDKAEYWLINVTSERRKTPTSIECVRCDAILACKLPSRALAFDDWHNVDGSYIMGEIWGDPWGVWFLWHRGYKNDHDPGDEDRAGSDEPSRYLANFNLMPDGTMKRPGRHLWSLP